MMPLPTNATVCATFPDGTYERMQRAGGSVAALPTAHRKPYPASRRSVPDITDMDTSRLLAARRSTVARASATKAVVVSVSGGRSTSRAARRVAFPAAEQIEYKFASSIGPAASAKLTLTLGVGLGFADTSLSV